MLRVLRVRPNSRWWKHFNFLCQSAESAKWRHCDDATDSCTRQAGFTVLSQSCHCLTAHSPPLTTQPETCEMFIIWRKILGTLLTFHRISSLSRFTKSSWLCLCDWQRGKERVREVACQRVSPPMPVYLLAFPNGLELSQERGGVERLALVLQAATRAWEMHKSAWLLSIWF